MTVEVHRRLRSRRGAIRSAGKPRSPIYRFEDVKAYAVTMDYYPSEDRLLIGYSIGRPLIPEPWLVVEEDPLDGLWLDPQVPVDYLLADIPIAQKFLNPMRREGAEKTAIEAVDRLLKMLRELDDLL